MKKDRGRNIATASYEIFNFAITFAPSLANICWIAIKFALA